MLTGTRTIKFALQATDYDTIEDVDILQVKKKMKFCEVEERDAWKVDFIKKVVNIKQNVLFIDDNSAVLSEAEELDFLIDCMTTS